jgi:hypothetical protein
VWFIDHQTSLSELNFTQKFCQKQRKIIQRKSNNVTKAFSHQIKDLIIWVNENKLNAGVIGYQVIV